jgi:hypothetical protein
LLHEQALATEGDERARLLSEAVTNFRDAYDVYTRDSLPQSWSETQYSLALVLRAKAATGERESRVHLLTEAIEAMRACLSVVTAKSAPESHAQRAAWIAEVEAELHAISAPGK